jgi:hypothetical protein
MISSRSRSRSWRGRAGGHEVARAREVALSAPRALAAAHPRCGVSSARLAARGARDDARAAARRHSGGREGMRTEARFSVAIAALPCSLRFREFCARGADLPRAKAFARAQRVPPRCRDTAPSSPKDCCNPLTRNTM